MCRSHGYISMVGWARAPQGAPVSSMAGKVNLAQSTTREIDLSGGGFRHHILEAAIMATTPTQTHSSENSPFTLFFNAQTDFTVLADYCEHFADALIENHHSGEKRILCYRLADCLNLLHPTLNDPIPPHLIERFTVDQFPNKSPVFEPESELLCGYCLTLAQLLSKHTFTADEEKQLTGLLFELVIYFADDLRAPRWIRTADGVKFIDEVAV
ncbi:ash family protein [Hafnia alvei]|uniref:ash family protein n=1 Tax=Hafnia alvei TaxID=569 RepID=UPI00187D26F0